MDKWLDIKLPRDGFLAVCFYLRFSLGWILVGKLGETSLCFGLSMRARFLLSLPIREGFIRVGWTLL